MAKQGAGMVCHAAARNVTNNACKRFPAPFRRQAWPLEETAKAVMFLAPDDSSYVTGAELFMYGGFAQVQAMNRYHYWKSGLEFRRASALRFLILKACLKSDKKRVASIEDAARV
jgi:hypothetical protein